MSNEEKTTLQMILSAAIQEFLEKASHLLHYEILLKKQA